MSWTHTALLIMALPGILSLGSRWFVRDGPIATVTIGLAFLVGAFGLILWMTASIDGKGLVGMLAPAFQSALGKSIVRIFHAHHQRDMLLIAYDPVVNREFLPDARYSAVFFVLALGLPFLATAFFVGG